MAFRSGTVSIPATTATVAYEAQPGDVEVWITGHPNVTVYLGGPDVDVNKGITVWRSRDAHVAFRSDVKHGDKVYAYVTTGPINIQVMVRSVTG